MLYGAMNFPVMPILRELETISQLGFDYFELTMDPPQAHHSIIREIKSQLLHRLDRLNMKLVCHLPSFLSIADLTDGIREASVREMIASLEVAAELRPLKVVIHPGYVTGIGVHVADLARRHAMTSLEKIVSRADKLGLPLCIENMFVRTRSLAEPTEFEELFAVLPTLKLTLDMGHAHIESRHTNRNLDFIRRFPDRLAHLHVSDNFGKDDNHLPVGAGTVDFRKIVTELKGIEYDKTATLEVFSRDKEYLRRSREKFAELMASD
jgi:sugar phosphate isomerase/epimerase